MAASRGRTLRVRGRIYTGDWEGEAVTHALWVEDGVVRATGDEALAAGRPDEARDLGPGECGVPGFWDSHIHLADYGFALGEVDLEGAESADAVVERLRAEAGPGDGTLVGRGWMVGRWRGPMPHRRQLDVLGDRPVLLWNHDHHSVWANTAALKRAGIDARVPDPAGGRVERDDDGEPTGILRDDAVDLVRDLWPARTPEAVEAALRRAQQALLSLGVTAVCTMQEGAEAVRALARLRDRGELLLRVAVYPPVEAMDGLIGAGLATGFGDDRLWLGGVKAFMDGALGSQTAWMRSPYREVEGTGLAMPFAAALPEVLGRLRRADLRLALHAIGDRAVAEAVTALAAPGSLALPERIEHAQLVPPDVVARWPGARLAASMQPVHLTDDLELMARFWGEERARHAFPLRSLRASGVLLLFGSDAPVSDPDPLKGLWAAVERRRPGGAALAPEEALTPAEALRAYAAAPAAAEGRPHLGRLTPGSPLALTVLSADPLAPQTDLSRLRVTAVLTAEAAAAG